MTSPAVPTRLSERFAYVRECLELFPHCVRCGVDLSRERLHNIVAAESREDRFAHVTCPLPPRPEEDCV